MEQSYPMRRRRAWLAHCSLLVLGAAGVGAAPAAAPTPAAHRPVILVVGDSMSAEYGLARGTGWVALLGQKLAAEGIAAVVVNASVSGDTSSGGRTRLPALLAQHRPTHVIIELGGNDALRGLPLAMTRSNLTEMVRATRAADAKVVLVGMQVPPNYGRQYTAEFAGMFAAIAQAERAALVPFLLAGVAEQADVAQWFQADRIHPAPRAQPVMMANVWPVLRPQLKR